MDDATRSDPDRQQSPTEAEVLEDRRERAADPGDLRFPAPEVPRAAEMDGTTGEYGRRATASAEDQALLEGDGALGTERRPHGPHAGDPEPEG